ncbi:c-type cytochrome [Salisediminibacterium beveridgei]|uniref:Membrane-attached cytochrome c550 n=1 Tax=Salisediminibacterium beveridgei TaxID=632773 RepID=A0A1D7QUB1_9BACI|nr:cytochrome c [Salisediminibacterium beveridgei]AOM82603.1 Membrane-attached cytochrome c550 [Salisediminibacterium beveridgei]
MRGAPLYPFAATAALGILMIVILSFVGLNVGQETAGENNENNENNEETQEFDDPIELGEHVYIGQCASCHGENLEGGGDFPALDGGAYSEEEILTAIEEGPGNMPAGLASGEEADAVALYILEQE